MRRIPAIILLMLAISYDASADIWKWTDVHGDVHYVNSRNPIYTWMDDYGRVQYADKPGHESAVSVDFVWHSEGDSTEEVEQQTKSRSSGSGWASADETAEERLQRENAEKYYCDRAREIYESYLNAPRLYESDENGEKVYLTEEQTAAKIKETEKAVAQVCQ